MAEVPGEETLHFVANLVDVGDLIVSGFEPVLPSLDIV